MKKLTWARHQKRWFGKWHTYLGIIAGAIIAVIGATGSILVFRTEIAEMMSPTEKVLTVPVQNREPLSFPAVIDSVRRQKPEADIALISYANRTDPQPDEAYVVHGHIDIEEDHHDEDGQEHEHDHKDVDYLVNPYTGEIYMEREPGTNAFLNFVTELHYSLLIPTAGRYIVGIATLILLVLTISGLRLWIPQKWKQLRSALTVNFKAGFKRQNLDWHNVIGLYTAPSVLLMSLTGVCMTFAVIVMPVLTLLSGKSPAELQKVLDTKSVIVEGKESLNADSLLSIAHVMLPEAKITIMAFPHDSVGTFFVGLQSPNKSGQTNSLSLIIDQYSGKVLYNSETTLPNISRGFMNWMRPIHYGSFGGLPTKIFACIGGLAPLALFITGFIIWWPRIRKQKGSSKSPKVSARAVEGGHGRYFLISLKKGFVYALWLLLIAGVMGALYGLPSGILQEPAVFSIVFTEVLVVINFAVAVLVILPNLFMWPFGKGYKPLTRYFALSLSFMLVFTGAYILIMNTGWKVF